MADPNLANLSRPGAVAGCVPNLYRVTLSELRGHRGIFPLAATFRVLAALVQMLGLERWVYRVFALAPTQTHLANPSSEGTGNSILSVAPVPGNRRPRAHELSVHRQRARDDRGRCRARKGVEPPDRPSVALP
jgi:hypothetical protein